MGDRGEGMGDVGGMWGGCGGEGMGDVGGDWLGGIEGGMGDVGGMVLGERGRDVRWEMWDVGCGMRDRRWCWRWC